MRRNWTSPIFAKQPAKPVCADCGKKAFRGEMFCSLACEKSYVLYLETGNL